MTFALILVLGSTFGQFLMQNPTFTLVGGPLSWVGACDEARKAEILPYSKVGRVDHMRRARFRKGRCVKHWTVEGLYVPRRAPRRVGALAISTDVGEGEMGGGDNGC